MATRFINIDRLTEMLLPPDMRDWLPEDHLVHFILETVESLNTSAFKHSAMSHDHAQKMLEHLEQEVKTLTAKAEQADASAVPSTVSLPAEIDRRDKRKAKIKEAVAVIESRHQEKVQEQKQAYKDKVEERQTRREKGETVGGHEPKPVDEKVKPSDPYNFIDPESRIMKAGTGKNFEQCYNAQAGVEVESMLIVGNYVTDHANDKRELTPNLEQIKNSGFTVETVLADTGYYSDDAVQAAEQSGVNALVAVAKSHHGLTLEDILTEKKDQIPPANATPQQIMAIKLKNKKGSEIYRLRKQTVEPVFGIIKQAMGFRQFLMRGKENVSIEWNLIRAAYNVKRIFTLKRQQQATALPVEPAIVG
ncbi:MAG: transposase [Opitutales bacterium]